MKTYIEYYLIASAIAMCIGIVIMAIFDWKVGPDDKAGYFLRGHPGDPGTFLCIPFHTWMLLACLVPGINIITVAWLIYYAARWVLFERRVYDFDGGTEIIKPKPEIDPLRISYMIVKGLVQCDGGKERIQVASLLYGNDGRIFPKEYFILDPEGGAPKYTARVVCVAPVARKVFVQFGNGPVVEYDADNLSFSLQYIDGEMTISSTHSLIENIYNYITLGQRPVTLEKHYG